MEKQNIFQAFVTFCKDLPKAVPICHISMIGAIGIFILVGGNITKYLALTENPEFKTAGSMIVIELILIWLFAFAMAVKARPTRPEAFCQYPPLKMLGGASFISIILGCIFGIILGHKMELSFLKSILYSFPGIIAESFLIVFLFVPTVPATLAAVKIKRDPTLAIADSFRNTWLFSALALLLIGLLLKWMAGDGPGLTPFLVTMNSSLITAICYAGFASGYYP